MLIGYCYLELYWFMKMYNKLIKRFMKMYNKLIKRFMKMYNKLYFSNVACNQFISELDISRTKKPTVPWIKSELTNLIKNK